MINKTKNSRSKDSTLGLASFLLVFILSTATVLAETTSSQQRMTFDEFIKAAKEQNLDLKIESEKSKAARANAKGARIPPPQLSYTKVTDRMGNSANGFEVNQTIPFPSKITGDYNARKYEAEAQEESRLGAELEILSRARAIYFNLWVAQQQNKALHEKKHAFMQHIKLSQALARSDNFLKIHLLNVESESDLLGNEIIASEQNIKEKEAIVAGFLNLDPATFHPTLDEPPPLIVFQEKISGNSHQLEAKRLSAESFRAREKAAKSNWLPDFYLRYKNVEQTQLVMSGYSEATIGISLPFVFPGDPMSNSEKTSALGSEARFEYEKDKRKIEVEKIILFEKISSLKKQIDNIKQKLLPRAENRIKVAHNLAPRDLESLREHLATILSFPDLKLEILALRMQYEASVAELLKYEGVEK